MRMNWVFQAGVASIALIALAACSSTTTSGTAGSGGTINTTTTTGSGGMGGSAGTGTFTGTKTCADLLTGTWSATLTGSDFDSEDAYNAYTALQTCACVDTNGGTPGGCANICTEAQNGTTTPNFCDGAAAGPTCQFCLNGTGTGTGTALCTTEYTACMSN